MVTQPTCKLAHRAEISSGATTTRRHRDTGYHHIRELDGQKLRRESSRESLQLSNLVRTRLKCYASRNDGRTLECSIALVGQVQTEVSERPELYLQDELRVKRNVISL